jgi:hypothetical protein
MMALGLNPQKDKARIMLKILYWQCLRKSICDLHKELYIIQVICSIPERSTPVYDMIEYMCLIQNAALCKP